MVYFAGGIWLNVYWPAAFDVACRTVPVVLFVNVIVAPGTTAPLGSLMDPRKDVVSVWLKADEIRENRNRRTQNACRLVTDSSRKIQQYRSNAADWFVR